MKKKEASHLREEEEEGKNDRSISEVEKLPMMTVIILCRFLSLLAVRCWHFSAVVVVVVVMVVVVV